MEYTVMDLFNEVTPKFDNVCTTDAIGWFKEDADKLGNVIANIALRNGITNIYDIAFEDTIDISEEEYSKFCNAAVEVWSDFSIIIGSDICMEFLNDTLFGKPISKDRLMEKIEVLIKHCNPNEQSS